MLPITSKFREQTSDIALTLHYGVEKPKNPSLWGAGEEFANVEALNDTIFPMGRCVGNVTTPLYGAEQKLRRIDARKNLRQPCLHSLQRFAGIFDVSNAVASLLRNIKFGIERFPCGQCA